MTDRLTDADLDYLDGYMWASPSRKQLLALVAEVLEHRAARTLTDDERLTVELERTACESYSRHGNELHYISPGNHRRLLAIIDRITEEADRD